MLQFNFLSFIQRLFSNPNVSDQDSLFRSLELNPQDGDEIESEDEGVELSDVSFKFIHLLGMFHFTSFRDRIIMLVGILFTFIHGAGFPILAVLFGAVCENLVSQTAISNGTMLMYPNHSANFDVTLGSKQEITVEDTFTAIGSRLGLTPGHGKLLTKDEFLDYSLTLSIYFACIGLLVLISSFIQNVCWDVVSANQILSIRTNFLSQILRQEAAWFEHKSIGYLAIKLADDIEKIREGTGRKFGLVLEYLSCFGVGTLLALATNWKLALILGSSAPIILAKVLFLMNLLSAQTVEQQETLGKSGAVTAEVLRNTRTVTAFGTWEDELELVKKDRKDDDAAALKHCMAGLGTGALYFVLFISYTIAFWYSCNQLAIKAISPNEVYTVFFCGSVSVIALFNLLCFIPDVASAYGCSRIIRALIQTMPTIDPYSKAGQKPYRVPGKIAIKKVTFSYPTRSNSAVLKGLSIVIQPGETVGICGESGSGKSTLALLLLRFFDVHEGHISLDDVDYRNLNVGWLRNQIGYSPQNITFKQSTIADNICAGRIGIKFREVLRVAKIAKADEFIRKLPEGYNTIIGITQSELSSGQCKLIALARSLLKNPPILVLDGCFSGMCSDDVAEICEDIKKFRGPRTTIIFSHVLADLVNIKKIFLLRAGVIIRYGTYEELNALKDIPLAKVVAHKAVIQDVEAAIRPDFEISGKSPMKVAARPTETVLALKPDDEEREIEIHTPPESVLCLKDFQLPSLKRILRDFKWDEESHMNYCTIVLGMTGAVSNGLVIPSFAYVLSQLFRTFSENPPEKLLSDGLFWVTVLVGFGIASGLGFWLGATFINLFGELLANAFQLRCLSTFLRQSMTWYDRLEHAPERLHIKLASDLPLFKSGLGIGMSSAIASVIAIISATVFTAVRAWQLLAVIILPLPFLFLCLKYQVKSCKEYEKLKAERLQPSLWMATNAIEDVRTIQTASRQRHAIWRYRQLLYPLLNLNYKQALKLGAVQATIEATTFFMLSGFLLLGTYFIRRGEMEFIDLFEVFLVCLFSGITVPHIIVYIPDYIKSKFAFGCMFEYEEFDGWESEEGALQGGQTPEDIGKICFENVSFAYEKGAPVLKNVSFSVDSGQRLGIVGSGGKSTILKLIERFYDVDSGRVTIGGVDIKKINLEYLRANIGYVEEEPILFNRSISENIRYGYKSGNSIDLQNEEVEVVADIVGLNETLIPELPNGFDTRVGQFGERMTFGDKKRIAIARMLIRHPPIVLLDEPASCMGPQEEEAILSALTIANTRFAKTTIGVSKSKRILTGGYLDYVLVLKDGMVAEFGKPVELLERKGAFYNIIQDLH